MKMISKANQCIKPRFKYYKKVKDITDITFDKNDGQSPSPGVTKGAYVWTFTLTGDVANC